MMLTRINKLKNFRENIYSIFNSRKDSVMNLLDAISSYGFKAKSVVELSEAKCFERKYSSITDAISIGLQSIKWPDITKEIFNKIYKTGEIVRVIELYDKEDISLRAGDLVMSTKNNNLGLDNSTIFKIKAINKKDIIIAHNGKEIVVNKDDKALKHIDYGYVLTINSAQGKDNENAILLLESFNKFETKFANFYVGISRSILNTTLVTDDKNRLMENILMSLSDGKTSALECVTNKTLKEFCIKEGINNINVVSKHLELERNQEKQNALIDSYKQEKRLPQSVKKYKIAKQISYKQETLIACRKKLTYSSNELHKDILKFDISKIQQRLQDIDKERFLTVKKYFFIQDKIKSYFDDKKEQQAFKLIQKRNALAHKITSQLDEHRKYLEFFFYW